MSSVPPSPGPSPCPPADLRHRRPRLVTLPEGSLLHRYHTAMAPDGSAFDPLYYDRSRNGRLNAPDGSYGVLYAAAHEHGAFAETFLRSPGRTLLPLDLIQAKAYVQLRLTRAMTIVEFHGPGQPVLGATSEVTSGPLPYDAPQQWSAALHSAFSTDGIAYKARHDNAETCYAIYDRAQDAVIVHKQVRDLDNDDFYGLLTHYNLGISF